jgi:hypothetical protein
MAVALLATAPKERATRGKLTWSLVQTNGMHEDDPGAEKVESGQGVQTERDVAGVTVLNVFAGQGLQSKAS